jgi:hypothetical protein
LPAIYPKPMDTYKGINLSSNGKNKVMRARRYG